MRNTPIRLAGLFALFSGIYAIGFWVSVTLDAESAWSRFTNLSDATHYGRAASHGDRTLDLMRADDRTGDEYYARLHLVAQAHQGGKNYEKAIAHYTELLDSSYGEKLPDAATVNINAELARMSLHLGDVAHSARLLATLLEESGDGAASAALTAPTASAQSRLAALETMAADIEQALPIGAVPSFDRETADRTAHDLIALGGYFVSLEGAERAAAGLLSAAYQDRSEAVGANNPTTVRAGLLLGPLLDSLYELDRAEDIYLSLFHAKEEEMGPNNPSLSLYIRLLANNYKEQGRFTEAEALNVHMRTIFRDAFGARRYLPNQSGERVTNIDRPVSPEFPLEDSYRPADLVDASAYGIPLSKPDGIDEMRISEGLAGAEDGAPSMPEQLVTLINLCTSPQERLTLRSGYRSYSTQSVLFARSNGSGKVAMPGASEHQTGLAVDIDVNRRLMRSTDQAFQCFEEQAWQYGFILSFPRNNTYLPAADPFEPWHWRYVGQRTALLYREIGPWGYPQEFLAALPCYAERALTGLYFSAEEEDVCLAQVLATADAGGETSGMTRSN